MLFDLSASDRSEIIRSDLSREMNDVSSCVQ